MIALSTWWKSTELDSGREILAQIRDLGFNAIELDCHLTGLAVDEMKPLLGSDFQVVSVHNFCPIPKILPKGISGSDVFSLSSHDREERERAVEYTIQTIELADSMDSRIVICHLGYVDIKDPTERLIELYKKDEKDSDDFASLLEAAKDNRQSKQERHLDAALFSLDKLNRRAESLDISIALENRNRLREIPDHDEIGIILSEFDGANVAYWHNTGYAHIQSNLGIIDHEDILNQYSEKMIGVHLHDVKDDSTHLAPGSGEVDFGMISKYLTEDAAKVMQLTSKSTREDIMQGLSHLEEKL